MIIRVKNHHMPPMIRVDSALGISSEPGVGEGEGEKGKQRERENTRFIYTYTHCIHICIKRIRFHCQNCNSYVIKANWF